MIELGLGRVHRLLAGTPFPWRAIHVAGTNGKGSVCAYVTEMLECYNHSKLIHHTKHRPITHGRFTSPHLVDKWDCVTINGKTISQQTFERTELNVKDRDASQQINSSEFEILTATAFEIFTRSNVDVAVVEVGMGGRLDATNIIGEGEDRLHRPLPLVTGIASIGLDHQQFLGSTLQSIAAEKCGIMKATVPVVACRQTSSDIDETISKHATSSSAGAVQFVSKETSAQAIWSSRYGMTSSLDSNPVQSRWSNGALAVQLVWSSLHELGRLEEAPVDLRTDLMAALCRVPSRTIWPGRLQDIDLDVFTGEPTEALLDGAHNIDSARMLRQHIDSLATNMMTTWFIACSAGKDIESMLKVLIKPGDDVVAVEFGPVDGMPWVKPLAAEKVAAAVKSAADGVETIIYGADISKALSTEASRAARQGRRIVVAGSLYLIGDVLRKRRQRLQGKTS